MFKKIAAVAAAALVGAALVPATNAAAASANGSYVGCYRTSHKGNYNDVREGVTTVISGSKVSAYANAMVSASCQRVNSLPIIHMRIYWTILSVNGKHVATSGLAGNGGTKGSIHVQSPYVTVPCGASIVVYSHVDFDYYDGRKVAPFTIHGPAFKRC